jgi:membrane protein
MAKPRLMHQLAIVRLKLAQFLHVAVQRYYGDMLSLRAASLTYSTLLSLVPFLAVTFSVLKAFGVQYRIEPFLTQALAPLGPQRIEITARLVHFVNNTRVDLLGAVGVAGLFYTVVSLVGTVEESLNQIWRARPSQAWTQRYGEYLGVLLVGPVLVFAGFALLASAQSYWLVQRLAGVRGFGLMLALLTRILPFFFLTAGFTFLYKLIPSTHVRLRSAVFGGAVAAILWQLAGIAFTAFVVNSVSYAAIYSGFAILVVFLIWLYVGWLIVLFGGEAAYLHQHASIYLPVGGGVSQEFIFQERLALSLLVEITRRFLTAKPPPTEKTLSQILSVPPDEIDPLVEKFIGRGMLLRSTQPEGISLARPPEDIRATEILDAVRGRINQAQENGDPVAQFLSRRDSLVHERLDAITLRSLAEGSSQV